jgi:hypothetical protein
MNEGGSELTEKDKQFTCQIQSGELFRDSEIRQNRYPERKLGVRSNLKVNSNGRSGVAGGIGGCEA